MVGFGIYLIMGFYLYGYGISTIHLSMGYLYNCVCVYITPITIHIIENPWPYKL